jgi:transcriptional regulator with XRE-family HTH domain
MDNESLNKIFAERLKELRTSQGLSLRELAENVGISYQALHHYENCKRDPSIWMVKKLADYFKVKIDWLIGTSEEKQ